MRCIGFTGTQDGLTPNQWEALREALVAIQGRGFTEFHHGDCIGADKAAHGIAKRLGLRVVCHPPDNSSKRAFCDADETLPEKPYLVRNRDIVDISGILVVCPNGMVEKQRSGTWATVRYARKRCKSILLIWPDGTAAMERQDL